MVDRSPDVIVRAEAAAVRAWATVHDLRELVARLALKDPYNEDGYCLWCGNGSWKFHGPDCAWADAKENCGMSQGSISPDIGRDQFERDYAKRSGVTVEWLRRHRTVRPCECGEDDCQGWQMVSHEAAADIDDPSKPWAR